MNAEKPILNVEKNTFFSYPKKSNNGNSVMPILKFNTSLKIFPGNFVFFIGKSGSGKSTLLEGLGLMNNTFKNNQGRILFNPSNDCEYEFCQKGKGIDSFITNYLRKTYFSFIFQQNALMKNYSIRKNIEFALRIKSINEDKSLDSEIKRMIKIFKLDDSIKDINQSVNELSGGEQQRIALIIAVLVNAKILFADEPTGNLDSHNSVSFFRILKENSNNDNTVIIVSHNLDLALDFGDVIVGIEKKNDIGMINKNTIFHKIINKESWISKNSKRFSRSILKNELERIILSDYA